MNVLLKIKPVYSSYERVVREFNNGNSYELRNKYYNFKFYSSKTKEKKKIYEKQQLKTED